MTGRIGLESSPFRGCVRAFITILVAAYPVSASAQATPQPAAPRAPSAKASRLQAAITVEGGGTLGAYEGGLTWALVETFRVRRSLGDRGPLPGDSINPVFSRLPLIEFRAAAGASAGSINAFLAANRWCSVDAADSAEKSTFWQAWVLTGITQLLPGRGRIGSRHEKGVLSRVFLDSTFKSLDGAWKKARYDPNCSLTFGAAITRLARDSLRISSQVHARNQRYAAAFTVRGAPARGTAPLYLQPPAQSNLRVRLGALVELPLAATGDTIPHDLAHDLIKASSGYPLVFAPYIVRYCPMRSATMVEASPTTGCRRGSSDSSYFVDGGVFDNGPLTLAYGLALADSSRLSLNNLYMLFITPNQRRNTGGKWDKFGEAPAKTAGAPGERASEGLDALMKVLQTFIPSARQYEMQIAARLLPSIQEADQSLDSVTIQLGIARATSERQKQRAAIEHELRVKEWLEGRSTRDSLKFRRDSLRYVLAQCRLFPLACPPAPEDSIVAAAPEPVLETDLSARPPAAVLASDTLLDATASTRAHFEKLLYVTRRWHPLAGDWLAGFGGLIGRPLREYDFYVGIYDAFALLSEKMLCQNSADPKCVERELGGLIRKPPIPVSRTADLVLRALYDEEHAGDSAAQKLAAPAVTPRDSVLLAVVRAMGARMDTTALSPTYCEQHGPLERLACSQGMTLSFERMRNTPNFTALIESPPAVCYRTRTDEAECATDERFMEFVDNPQAALNRLAGEVLYRITATTPGKSGMQMPLTMANAMYFATNERSRKGWDRGSVSLPISLKWPAAIFYTLFPSSIGGFIGIPGWYAEWALRHHVNSSLAVGGTARIAWASGFTRTSPVARGRHFIPSFRTEWKLGGPAAPWVSTLGLDVAYWTDWEADQLFPRHMRKTGMAVGMTSALFAQKVRVSWQTRPGKYVIRGGDKPWSFVSIGLGDASGTAYWIARVLSQKFR